MNEAIRVEICAPESAKITLEAVEAICPGEDGFFSVRKGHTALLTTLVPGVLALRDAKGNEQFFAVSGGFAEVEPDRVLILADAFEEGSCIDSVRAKAAEERAATRLKKPDPETDLKRAELALYRAAARLKAAKRSPF